MAFTRDLREWLVWLTKVRILVISFLLAIGMAIRTLTDVAVPLPFFLGLILLWYMLSIFYSLLLRLNLDLYVQAYVQILFDLAIITGIVYLTGGLDSYFISLYLLAIIVASILLSRTGAYLVAAVSFILLGALLEASFYGLIASFSASHPGLRTLQVYIFSNLFAFMAVAYMSSYLAESLRKTGVELEDKSGAFEELQAFNENIIHSMRGGLITTDLTGRILLLNRAGEEITGYRFSEIRGLRLHSIFPGFQFELPRGPAPFSMLLRKEITFATPAGQAKYLGVTLSPLLTRDKQMAGYVYNFQDLTEMKRLEREVAIKERMAALGRMAAAIAHEIRNPLASISGSVKVLGSITPLGEEHLRLVQIVTRESERLNEIVNDFLNYSREKTYEFAEKNIVELLEETLVLLENCPGFNGKCRIQKVFPPGAVLVAVDADKMKQVFWNLCDNALRAMPNGGTLRVEVLDSRPAVKISFADTGIGLDEKHIEKIFEPFQSTFPGGTGLGLAIVYQIVQAHHGKITVQSKPNAGSRFVIELPKE